VTTPQIWDVYRAAAEKARSTGDYGSAEQQWLSALELAEELGEDSPKLTIALENLVEVLWYQQKFSQAAPILRRLMRIYQRRHGKQHFDVGIIANNMAMLYHAWGKHADAEPFYLKALAIKRDYLGDEHPETVSIMCKYADLLLLLKRDDEARRLQDYVEQLRQSGAKLSGEFRETNGSAPARKDGATGGSGATESSSATERSGAKERNGSTGGKGSTEHKDSKDRSASIENKAGMGHPRPFPESVQSGGFDIQKGNGINS